jgi:hypothetical protein
MVRIINRNKLASFIKKHCMEHRKVQNLLSFMVQNDLIVYNEITHVREQETTIFL